MFKHIAAKANEASMVLAQERGACPDAEDTGAMERFSCKMAIAPTASIIIICGGTSACIEPIPANIYTHKTLSGSFVGQESLSREAARRRRAKDSTNVWNSILEKGGSVQHLDFLTAEEKAAYKTSFEIDQRWLLEFAADRTPFIDQAQSLNLFIPADVDKWDLMMLHFQAWEKGIKSLYYLRSQERAARRVRRRGRGGQHRRRAEDRARRADRLRGMPRLPVRLTWRLVDPLWLGIGATALPSWYSRDGYRCSLSRRSDGWVCSA